jgi:hypothetical protein
MSDLLQRLSENPVDALSNWPQIREEIHKEHERATTTALRVTLLAMHKAILDMAERTVAPGDMDRFKVARLQDYRLLIIREALIGENVCAETLNAVTEREVAAGRMAPDNDLRETALRGIAAPHLSRAELLEMDAKQRAAPMVSDSKPVSGWRRALAWIRGG